jgi:hypothetical protein
MQFKSFMEALKGKQHKIDKNKNGQIDSHDFKLLRKEEEELGEAKMSDADVAEKERIVKGMKKNLAGFKSKYGERAKEVMYATATKQAMKEETVEEAVQKADIPAYLRKQQGQTPLKLSDLKRKDTISDKENLAKLRNEESELEEGAFADDEGIAKKLVAKHGKNVQSHDIKLALHMHPEGHKTTVDRVAGHVKKMLSVKEEVEELDEKSEQAKRNKTMKNMMDASRGARYKLNNPVPAAEPEHKTARAHNVAIGRALRSEEKKDDVPFEGPYTKTKPAKNSDGTTQSPMSRARALAKDAMKKQMKEDIDRLFEKDDNEYNYEGEMAVTQLKTIMRHAEALQAKMKPDTNLPEWVQSKITLATDYIQTASDYLHSELEEQAPVAEPINDMPTNMKEETALDEVESKTVSYGDFISNLLEYETKGGRYVHKGTYGGSYTDPEGADDADDKKPKQQPAEKRGRGRPAGAKSGAGKITGTSKLYK